MAIVYQEGAAATARPAKGPLSDGQVAAVFHDTRMVQHGLAVADPERLYIGHDASGGSAFGILRQSIAEREPCLLAGSPDVFSGLESFWQIQAAARQADDTGARPFGEQ